MTVFGYARKDYPTPLVTQMNRLLSYKCDTVFVESSSFDEDSELKQLLSELGEGDLIVVEKLMVFGKGIDKLANLFELLLSRNCHLLAIDGSVDTRRDTTFFTQTIALANFEKAYRSNVTKQRLAKSKRSGVQLGRPMIDKATIKQIKVLHQHSKLSMRDIAVKCNVSLGSVHKYIH